jgi:ribosomal protein S18 acetylase RimI-like enzyme
MNHAYIIKSPENEAEVHGMWRLNHTVFAEEYPQHPTSEDGCLIDKFHGKNIYRIAWDGKNVLGMISAHWRPPFSAVAKFGGTVERHIVDGKTAEIRLLALQKEVRGTSVAVRLAVSLMTELQSLGMERLVISGISVQVRFYRHVGFEIVGEPVSENGILFYPMIGRLEEILSRKDICERYACNLK